MRRFTAATIALPLIFGAQATLAQDVEISDAAKKTIHHLGQACGGLNVSTDTIEIGEDFRPCLDAISFEMQALAETWRPWRAVAARVLWTYYRTVKGREGAPIEPTKRKRGKNGR